MRSGVCFRAGDEAIVVRMDSGGVRPPWGYEPGAFSSRRWGTGEEGNVDVKMGTSSFILRGGVGFKEGE